MVAQIELQPPGYAAGGHAPYPKGKASHDVVQVAIGTDRDLSGGSSDLFAVGGHALGQGWRCSAPFRCPEAIKQAQGQRLVTLVAGALLMGDRLATIGD